MFEHSTYRIEHGDGVTRLELRGRRAGAGVLRADAALSRRHAAHQARHHQRGHRASTATAPAPRCYATVFQQTDVLPLQPIASGRYVDQFERVGGTWRFADRLITGFLLGDRSQHVVWHDGTPDDGTPHDAAAQRPI